MSRNRFAALSPKELGLMSGINDREESESPGICLSKALLILDVIRCQRIDFISFWIQ